MSERLSGTVTFLFTDIEGSTSLLKQLGRDAYGELLAEQQRLLREQFATHHGEEIDNQGDSFFVAFRSAPDAVAAAVAIQRSLADHEWPEGAEVRVRIGIHTGEAAAAGERYVGFSVHRAARIGDAAHGGQVLLSSTTRDLAEDDLPQEIHLRDLGLWRLKDVDRPERITQVAAEGLKTEFPPLRGAERVNERPTTRRRSLLVAAVIGVVAAAVAIPVFALSSGGSNSTLNARVVAPVGPDSVGVFESGGGRAVAQVSLGKHPSEIATGAGAVWAVNGDDDAVTKIDPKTNTVEDTITVGDAPSGLAIGGGFVWVANSLGASVSQIDPRTNQTVNTIHVGGRPSGIAFGQGGVWVADASDNAVRRIDPGAGSVGRLISVSAGANAIAAGEGAVWVVGQSGGVVTKLDPGSGNEQPIHVGNGPSAITVGGGAVWVANTTDGTVSRIDAASDAVTGTSVGSAPNGVAVSPDGGTVWVSNEQSGSLSRIDAKQNAVAQTIVTGNRPEGVAVNAQRVYAAVRGTGVSHRGGTLTVDEGTGSGSEADYVDPALAYTTPAWQLLLNTNDGLVTYDRVGGRDSASLVPDLATSLPIPTDHGLTYTFQIRPGIHYSTGALVRPADFRRAIERALLVRDASGNAGPGLNYYTEIVGATECLKAPKRCDLNNGVVVGSDTVAFHLTAADPEFLYKLALLAWTPWWSTLQAAAFCSR
jgi:YVTN family beta-propeller protein